MQVRCGGVIHAMHLPRRNKRVCTYSRLHLRCVVQYNYNAVGATSHATWHLFTRPITRILMHLEILAKTEQNSPNGQIIDVQKRSGTAISKQRDQDYLRGVVDRAAWTFAFNLHARVRVANKFVLQLYLSMATIMVVFVPTSMHGREGVGLRLFTQVINSLVWLCC